MIIPGYRSGVLVLWHQPSGQVGKLVFACAILGFICVILHPTPAAVYGASASRAVFFLALLLLLPMWRRIVLQPACALFLAAAVIAVLGQDPLALALPLLAYPLFLLVFYNPRASFQVYAAAFLFLGGGAVLQAITPDDFLSAHRITDSATNPDGDFLQSYRPSSLYPAQIYYSQFVLLLVPVLVICRRYNWMILVSAGLLAAIIGSTAGTMLVFLLTLLALRGIKGAALLAYLAGLGLIYLLDTPRFHYNFSVLDLTGSVQARFALGATGGGSDIGVVSVLGQTTRMGILVLLSSVGAMLAGMIIPLSGLSIRRLWELLLAVLALMSIQVVHNIAGSVFSTLSLAGFAALQWELVRALKKRKPFVPTNLN